MIGSLFGTTRAGRSPRYRLAAGACAAAAATAALVAGGVLASSARGLTSVTAFENINNDHVPIGYSASDSPDSTWTSVGSLTDLLPGSAYVVLAKLNLRSNASVPAGVSCALKMTNEPTDQTDASFAPVKGSTMATLSFQGLTLLRGSPGGYPVGGSATLSCHVTGAGADKQVVASDARILAIPVDNVTNNLRTFTSAG